MTEDDKLDNTEPFKITSIDEAIAFSTYISNYGGNIFPQYDIKNSIQNVYNYSRNHCEDPQVNGKLLSAFVDLEIIYLYMMKDVSVAGGVHNDLNAMGKIGTGSVLRDFESSGF